MVDPRVLDPREEVVDRSGLSDADVEQIVRLLEVMGAWREAERATSEASQRYMKLGETDMRALRYLIAAKNQGRVVTPGAIAAHLRISTASTTKLLDRLAQGDHIRRLPHPSDRRSLAIEVTEHTRQAARQTVGRAHARRFQAAAALSTGERESVIRFLQELTASAHDSLHEHDPGSAAS